MTTFEDISDRFKACLTAGPASEEMISAAQSQLGVRFPPSYRRFLETYGAALCPDIEIAGLFTVRDENEPPLWSDVVTSNLQMHRAARLLSSGLVAISGDGGDYTYCLDTTSSQLGEECPVVALGPGVDCVLIGENFPDFVVRSFEGRVNF
ncbi:MAG TPA: hypothetical protein DD490_30035 [Acidobacteria bacterium]|nr:hypothetical protein [Acidobacteriota bacterium]